MQKLIIASTGKSAGKTCFAVGLAKSEGKSFGYMKPFGDRMLYRKKRLWDYDAALISGIFEFEGKAEDMSIGFDHAKMRFTYDAATMKEAVVAKANELGDGKDLLIIEAGGNMMYGSSVNLDAISLARFTGAKMVLVAGGDDNSILDEITFAKKYIDMSGVGLAGVVINNVQDVDDFKNSQIEVVASLGLKVFGVIPTAQELSFVTAGYLAERMFAKVLAGEQGLGKVVKNIFVGAMSGSAALSNPLFNKENKLVITSGDRGDMILTALEQEASCVVLTNSVLPTTNIISQAASANIPLLLVPWDTHYTDIFIDRLEPMLTPQDTEKIDLISKLVSEHVDVSSILA